MLSAMFGVYVSSILYLVVVLLLHFKHSKHYAAIEKISKLSLHILFKKTNTEF